jgi:hypothetical protein
MKSAISPRHSMLHPVPPRIGYRSALLMRRVFVAFWARFTFVPRVLSQGSSGRFRGGLSQPLMGVSTGRSVPSRRQIFGRQGKPKTHAATVFSEGGFKSRNVDRGIYDVGGVKPAHWQAFLQVAQNRSVVREFEAATAIYNSRNTSAAIIQRVMRTTRGSSV